MTTNVHAVYGEIKIEIYDVGGVPWLEITQNNSQINLFLKDYNVLEDLITICKQAHENFLSNESKANAT